MSGVVVTLTNSSTVGSIQRLLLSGSVPSSAGKCAHGEEVDAKRGVSCAEAGCISLLSGFGCSPLPWSTPDLELKGIRVQALLPAQMHKAERGCGII